MKSIINFAKNFKDKTKFVEDVGLIKAIDEAMEASNDYDKVKIFFRKFSKNYKNFKKNKDIFSDLFKIFLEFL